MRIKPSVSEDEWKKALWSILIIEATVQKMKNELSKMKEKPLKAYLQKNAEQWKEVHKKNCITLTKIYENEAAMLEKLEKRYEVVSGQYSSVSSAFSHDELPHQLFKPK